MSLSTNASLSVVATPIGNLDDITLRALAVLRDAAVIACEDTRHAKRLLQHYAINTPLLSLHEHNELAAAGKLIDLLGAGKSVALISDAGTPAISDPGARAVAAVRQAGFRITPLPGPSAAIAALSAAGMAEDSFHFVGFLPAKSAARRAALGKLQTLSATLVFYEAPHRVKACVDDLLSSFGPQRHLVIARELSKMFEQIVAMPLADAPAWLAADDNHCRGEFVLLLSAAAAKTQEIDAESERILKLLLAELPLKQAAQLGSDITGVAKKKLYAHALSLRDG